MTGFFWVAVFIGLIIYTIRQPRGRRVGGVIVAAAWILAYPYLVTSGGVTPEQTSLPNALQLATKPKTASLKILVTPKDARITMTGPSGYYRKVVGPNKFGNLAPGDYVVTISKPGYVSAQTTYSLAPGDEKLDYFEIKTPAQIAAAEQAAKLAAEKEANCSNVQFIVEKWSWGRSSDSYVEARGLVTNVSGQSLNNAVAKIIFFTGNGEFITSEDALIDYRPVLNGQSSPFSVIASYNPAMARAQLELAEFWGSTYKIIDRKTWDKYQCGSK